MKYIDKFQKAHYPLGFTDNIVNYFIKSTNHLEDSYIIPSNLFEEQKVFVLIEILFCDRMRISQKTLLENFMNLLAVSIKWITKK